jgi:hypothetical protein
MKSEVEKEKTPILFNDFYFREIFEIFIRKVIYRCIYIQLNFIYLFGKKLAKCLISPQCAPF